MSRHSNHLTSYLKSKRENTNKIETKSKSSASATKSSSNRLGKKSTVSFAKSKRTHESLPSEVILKIFTFLTPTEILTCARVCKSWSYLSNETSLWLRHYNHIPRPVRDSIVPDERQLPSFQWKREIIKRTLFHRNKKAKTIFRKSCEHIGVLRRQVSLDMEKCFKFLSLKWQLEFTDKNDNITSCLNDDIFYHTTTLTVRWYNLQLPSLSTLKSFTISACAAVFYHRDWTPHINSATTRALIRSYELKDLQLCEDNTTSNDSMISFQSIQPGLMIAVWKDSWKKGGDLAWISVCLPYHQLLEKIIRGTRNSAYIAPCHEPILDDLDPLYGLQRYSATIELRNQRKTFWCHHYRELFRISFGVNGLVLASQQTQEGIFNDRVSFLWKTPLFKNTLNDIVIVDLTLMDEHKKSLWIVSSAVKVIKKKNDVDFAFLDEERSLVEYKDDTGSFRIQLFWVEVDSQTIVKDLEICLSKAAINNWFGTHY